MNFVHSNTAYSNTFFVGFIRISYDTLVEVFGEPTLGRSGDGKIQVEWCLKFEDGIVATIFDWKEYRKDYRQVTTWRIAGHEEKALDRIQEVLKKADKHYYSGVDLPRD
jgi:hypothetical protein